MAAQGEDGDTDKEIASFDERIMVCSSTTIPSNERPQYATKTPSPARYYTNSSPYMGIDEFFRCVGKEDYENETYQERIKRVSGLKQHGYFNHMDESQTGKLRVLETLKPKDIFHGSPNQHDLYASRPPSLTRPNFKSVNSNERSIKEKNPYITSSFASVPRMTKRSNEGISVRIKQNPGPPALIPCIDMNSSNEILVSSATTAHAPASTSSTPSFVNDRKHFIDGSQVIIDKSRARSISNGVPPVSFSERKTASSTVPVFNDHGNDDEEIDIVGDVPITNHAMPQTVGRNTKDNAKYVDPSNSEEDSLDRKILDEADTSVEKDGNMSDASCTSEVYNIEETKVDGTPDNSSSVAESLLALRSSGGASSDADSVVKTNSTENKQPAEPVKKRGGGKLGRRRKRGYIYDPKPLVSKTKTNSMPNNLKDEEYWHRRQRNNEAAKRSRENRRVKELETMNLVKRLTDSNAELKQKIQELELRNLYLERLLRGSGSDGGMDSGEGAVNAESPRPSSN